MDLKTKASFEEAVRSMIGSDDPKTKAIGVEAFKELASMEAQERADLLSEDKAEADNDFRERQFLADENEKKKRRKIDIALAAISGLSVVTTVGVQLLGFRFNRSLARDLCEFEKTGSLISLASKTLIPSMFKRMEIRIENSTKFFNRR